MLKLLFTCLIILGLSCTKAKKNSSADGDTYGSGSTSSGLEGAGKATKLTTSDCTDPELSDVKEGVTFTLCNGQVGVGTQAAPSLASPDPWDVRYGVTVGSTTGKLKINCRNMVNLASYDSGNCSDTLYRNESDCTANTETWTADGFGSEGSIDATDTVDDYANNNGAFPSENPWSGGDQHFCGYNLPSDPTWERVITTPATNGATSVYQDKISGLRWTRGTGTATHQWSGATTYCGTTIAGHGGIAIWRVPTQKELMAAYEHGIHDLDSGHTSPDHLDDLDNYFWSSSTLSDVVDEGWNVYMRNGNTYNINKALALSVLCVSP